MSLNSMFNIGVSSLRTSQDQLRVTADNIANINTPGYIRKTVQQQSVTLGGAGQGVATGQVRLSTDKYLQAASLKAISSASSADISYELIDQIQAQFGNITDDNTLFSQMTKTLTAMAQAAEDPTSSTSRQVVISNLNSFLSEGGRISEKVQQVRQDADSRIATGVKTINDLLKNINALNATISSSTVSGGDATGAVTAQSQYIDELARHLDISVSQNANGGVTVRTPSGLVLSNDMGYATLDYTPAATVNADTNFSAITVNGVSGETRDLADYLTGGELKGLMDVRDKTAPGINDQLSEYMRQYAEGMNATHNLNSAVPAPTSLSGRNTSLSLQEAVSGFTGQTSLVTLNADGDITNQLVIDFDTNSFTLNGAAAGTFTAATFETDVNTALGGAATIDFNDGALSITGGGTNRVAVVETGPGSTNEGRAFSHFFGLNDLITSEVPLSNRTGLDDTSNHGFPGGTVNFSLKNATGATLANVAFSVPAGGTVADLVNALNNTTTGVGRYGTFSFDNDTGTLSFKGFGNPSNALSVASDSTTRLGSGASFTQFFGIGGSQGTLASQLKVRTDVSNNPASLALARVNMTAVGGVAALVRGDGTGGQAMSDLANASLNFGAAGNNPGGISTLERYASDLAGQVGNMAATAKTNRTSQQALLNEAAMRRDSVEGVNLDEELINMTTYQQAYTAAGRLIQAAKDMYDVLLNMV